MSSFLSSSPSGKFHHQRNTHAKKTNDENDFDDSSTSCVYEKEDSPVVLKKTKTKKTKHGVRVYILQRNECDNPSLLQKYERLLSRSELDSIQIESLHPETKKERLQTRAMVRTVLSSILNEERGGRKPSRKVVDPSSLEFTFNEKGKPFLKYSTTTSSFANSNEEEKSTNSFSTSMSSENLNIQFSVSHSKNVVAMAVTTDGRRVGIDCEVEKRRTKDACLKLAKRYFRKGEAVERIETALAKEEDWGRRMFVRYWCLCESYVKALGVGISGRPFRNFDIAVTEKRNADEREDISLFESDPETFGRWRFQLFRETPTIKVKEDERSIVAVCVEDDDSDEDEDDDTNTNRNHTSHPSKRKRRPPIVSSITRVRPLLDDIDDSNYNNEKSSSAAIADIEDDDIEILAASS